ncbi:hypothetical protein E1B28_004122 [Marasmius oreades]|uniref:SMP domain-containing protein n=1 Tax=Marasmius oreades TaxID=181124 RepID=A0A9P7UY53_9AGAR|nr:uncharacterized protein E1B28_004122 [Marasmius oreades]KAG7096708.1 hypothetical protein E1B28_004122 [Marasmius oreades]
MAGIKAPKKPMTTTDAARIQSAQAKAGNDVGKRSFPARAQSAAQNNVNKATGGAGAGSTPKAATGKPASGTSNKKK